MITKMTKSLFIVSAALAFTLPSFAQGGTTIQGIGTASAISGNQFAGQGKLRIGNLLVPETSLVTILALGPGPGNTLYGESTHEFNLGSYGTFATRDSVWLAPIDAFGNFQLLISAQIVSGTGSFLGASGGLVLTGVANLATGRVMWKMQGQLN